MQKQKKRNKKHNAKRRFERVAKAALKNQAVIFVGGWEGCQLVDLHSRRIYRPGEAVALTLGEIKAKWSVFCAVFCRAQDGQQYMKSISIHTSEEYYQEDLLETLNDVHQDLMDTCNAPHVANVGWMASPAGDELDEDLAGEVFGKAEAWNQKSRYELAQEAEK